MIHVNSFVKRQTPESEFSHFDGTWGELVSMVTVNLHHPKQGYRDEVILIPVPPDRFFTNVKVREPGDEAVAKWKTRRPGEEPRLQVRCKGLKTRAKSAFIVLYSSKVLAEDGDNELPPNDDNWEIISINCAPTEEEMPIQPSVLMHNHFGSDGGTATNMSPEEFEDLLRKSFAYWRDKVQVIGQSAPDGGGPGRDDERPWAGMPDGLTAFDTGLQALSDDHIAEMRTKREVAEVAPERQKREMESMISATLERHKRERESIISAMRAELKARLDGGAARGREHLLHAPHRDEVYQRAIQVAGDLRKRAAIRRKARDRRSVEEGKPDRLADQLDLAADTIEDLAHRMCQHQSE